MNITTQLLLITLALTLVGCQATGPSNSDDYVIEEINKDAYIAKRFHENGNLKMEMTYKNGNKISSKLFNASGNLISETTITGDYEVSSLYHDGKMTSQSVFIAGTNNGLATLFHPNGEIMMTGKQVNGVYEGLVSILRPNGSRKYDAIYANGKQTGWIKVYNLNSEPVCLLLPDEYQNIDSYKAINKKHTKEECINLLADK